MALRTTQRSALAPYNQANPYGSPPRIAKKPKRLTRSLSPRRDQEAEPLEVIGTPAAPATPTTTLPEPSLQMSDMAQEGKNFKKPAYFSEFDGACDSALAWINGYSRGSDYAGVSEKNKCLHLFYHLRVGPPLEWAQLPEIDSLIRQGVWENLLNAFKERWSGSISMFHQRDIFYDIKQKDEEDVQTFSARLATMAARITPTPDNEAKMGQFLKGIKPELYYNLIVAYPPPTTLRELTLLAATHERGLLAALHRGGHPNQGPAWNPARTGLTSIPGPYSAPTLAAVTMPTPQPAVANLFLSALQEFFGTRSHKFNEEKEDKNSYNTNRNRNDNKKKYNKKKIECYYCGKVGHKEFECRKKIKDEAGKKAPPAHQPSVNPNPPSN